ncbi:MAG TPA: FtsX-like permease family protein [Pilimelia sp.]|nr:FtsX-like permease family protein [Pilimelia sp.]
MTWLARRMLRHHRGGFLATFVSLFVGAVIVMACGGLLETGVRAEAAVARFAAAPIVVTGDQFYPGRNKAFVERVRLPESLLAAVAAVPGVRAAVPDTSFPVVVTGPGGRPAARTTGHGWASAGLAPYGIVRGAPPRAAGEVALDPATAGRAGAGPGDAVQVAAGGRVAEYRLVGLTAGDPAAAAYFSSADARRLSGSPGTVDAIGVFPAAGADPQRVRAAVAAAVSDRSAVVLTGAARGGAEHPGTLIRSKNLISLAAVFGGLATTVAVFVVASTLGLVMQHRRRETAMLRAVGTTTGQIRRMLLLETSLVAVAATALAWFPAPVLGRRLFAGVVDAGVVPAATRFHQGWVPMLAGAGVALVAAVGATLIAARAATRTAPAEAMAEAAAPRRWFSWPRLLTAVLALAGAAILAVVTATVIAAPKAASTATPAAMLWAGGLALLGPGLTVLVLALVRWPIRACSGLAGYLAILNAKSSTLRLAGAVLPVMLASGLATALIYLQTTQSDGMRREFAAGISADAVVGSGVGGLTPDAVRRVAAAPGVAVASAYVPSSGFLVPPTPPAEPGAKRPPKAPAPAPLPLLGIDAGATPATVTTTVVAGSLAALSGDTIALPQPVAEEAGVGPGGSVALRWGDGAAARLRVVAVLDGRRGFQPALVPARTAVRHTTDGLVPRVLVRLAPGTTVAEFTAGLRGITDAVPAPQVLDRAGLHAAAAEQDDTAASVGYLLIAVVIAYSVIALLNSLAVATVERRREFALQRLLGATRAQILRMVTVEAILVTMIGLLLGAVMTFATVSPLALAMTGSALPAGPGALPVVVAATAAVLTLLGTLLPTALALRAAPVTASVS